MSYYAPVTETTRYAVGELAELGGVSRRTVRYYVQEGLLPAPLGVGRGRHYGPQHFERLLQVKAWQEQGKLLEEIRRLLSQGRQAAEAPPLPEVARGVWTRVEFAPGLELHVSGDQRLPSPGKLAELAEWCRREFRKR